METTVTFSLVYFTFFALIQSVVSDHRRPEYIIGHMTNSIEEVIPYLDDGANALESDIQFYSNGSIKEAYHGCLTATDCFRICYRRVDVSDYLKHLRDITDPKRDNSYYDKLIAQMFDLKLENSDNLEESGRDLARHILDYLWSKNGRGHEVRAIIYINEVKYAPLIKAFLQEFKDREKLSRLKDVGFDVGIEDINNIKNMFEQYDIENVWLGDGTFNCLSAFRPTVRLEEELDVRNSNAFIKKVYDWTIDSKYKMRKSLDLGIDGFITNVPSKVVEVLEESEYRDKFRIATPQDPPFKRFQR